jgi:hypothetical protein
VFKRRLDVPRGTVNYSSLASIDTIFKLLYLVESPVKIAGHQLKAVKLESSMNRTK